MPGYQSYMGSCVYHTSNHTFVSRNLNSLAFNYAVGEGGAVIGRGLTKYNALTGQYCSSSAAKSLQTHTAMLNQMVAANQTLAVRALTFTLSLTLTNLSNPVSMLPPAEHGS